MRMRRGIPTEGVGISLLQSGAMTPNPRDEPANSAQMGRWKLGSSTRGLIFGETRGWRSAERSGERLILEMARRRRGDARPRRRTAATHGRRFPDGLVEGIRVGNIASDRGGRKNAFEDLGLRPRICWYSTSSRARSSDGPVRNRVPVPGGMGGIEVAPYHSRWASMSRRSEVGEVPTTFSNRQRGESEDSNDGCRHPMSRAG